MKPFLIYLWGIADGAKMLCGFSAMILAALCFILWAIGDVSKTANFVSLAKFAFPIFLALAVLIPDSETIAAMVILPRIAESEAVKRDLPELYRAAVDALKEKLKP